MLRVELPAAEVPLADRRGGVAGGLESLGDGHRLERQVLGPVGDRQLRMRPLVAGDPVGEVQPGGILAGQHGGAGRRADGAGGITAGEPHARGREPVDVRRLDNVAPLAGEVLPAQIVDEHHDHVGAHVSGPPGAAGHEKPQGEQQAEAGHAGRLLGEGGDAGGATRRHTAR